MKARYVHTNLVAADWRRLCRFYCEVFGCEVVPPERRQSGAWLARGTGVADAALEGAHLRLPGPFDAGPTLEIFQYHASLAAPHRSAANRQGLGHLAFEVDDVTAFAAEVVAAGGTMVGNVVSRHVPQVGTLTFVYVADPEGNLIELQHWDC
ncbi:MAG: VOC family protein [Myxococcota bacterium]